MYDDEVKLSVGTKVKVLRAADDCENGWQNTWVNDMNSAVGHVGVITNDTGYGRYNVAFSTAPNASEYAYPGFVLEVVEE